MSYTIDPELQQGIDLLKEGKKINTAFKLINHSALNGTTKGKSYFQVGTMVKDGVSGLEANPEEAKPFFDMAMQHFMAAPCDSLDYREMGDYYNYGLGTQDADKIKALEYYDKASEEDEIAKQRADEIRASAEKGDSNLAPVLEPETVVAEQENEVNVESGEPDVVVSPTISNESADAPLTDKIIDEEINADQVLIKAIRILDSATANKQDKLDAVELVKIASEQGSIRACVLMGYLYEGDNSLVSKDLDMAKKYYDLGIEHGSCSAKFRLGILYTDKETSYYDLNKGHDMIIESAREGYSYALNYLGDCFREKVDDVRNLELAYRYYALAGERGLGLGYHYMAEIDASRQQLDLAKIHDKLASDNAYDNTLGYQDPLFYTLHI